MRFLSGKSYLGHPIIGNQNGLFDVQSYILEFAQSEKTTLKIYNRKNTFKFHHVPVIPHLKKFSNSLILYNCTFGKLLLPI